MTMEFVTKKAPIVQNSQRTYKRSLNLHIALLVVALASVVVKAFVTVPDDAGFTALDQAFKAFMMLAVGAFASVLIELVYSLFEGTVSKFEQYKAYVEPISTGLLIAMLLPTITPIYVLLLAVFVGVFAGKLVYGGYGFYIFNPALVGALFAKLSFKAQLVVDGTPLILFKDSMNGASYTFNSIWPLIVGNYEAIAIGSTSVLILFLAFIYLCVTRVIDLRIAFTYLISIVLITVVVGYINDFNLSFSLINLLVGLTAFSAVFLISEPVSTPTSRETKMIYAAVVAVIMMAVRILGTQTEGLIFAILFGNMITPFLNRTVKRSDAKSFLTTLIVLVIVVVGLAFVIGNVLKNGGIA